MVHVYLEQGLGKLWPTDQIQPAAYFGNKVLWEHSQAHLFI